MIMVVVAVITKVVICILTKLSLSINITSLQYSIVIFVVKIVVDPLEKHHYAKISV